MIERIAGAASEPDALWPDLCPVDPAWLDRRLVLLWRSHDHSRFSADPAIWLAETSRLLADLPRDILAAAIDRAVQSAASGFMPTVGQIRAFADPTLRAREVQVAMMEARRRSANLPRLPAPPRIARDEQITPEQVRAVLRDHGFGSIADRLENETAKRSTRQSRHHQQAREMNHEPRT